MPKFSDTEQKIIKIFTPGTKFTFEGKEYEVLVCDKPRPSSGECKTDVFLLVSNSGSNREIKISIKQNNADFIENKMSYERATEIFGNDTDMILSKSLEAIKSSFESQYLVLFEKYMRTEAMTIKLGWKFELLNKPGGSLSGELILTHDQLMNVYSGTKLPDEKRNAYVNGQIVNESGVANYIMFVDQDKDYTKDYCVQHLTSINDYVSKHNKIYFACKALNYRIVENKWDGDRPLAVFVDWNLDNGKLIGNINISEPLKHKGNEIGNKIINILKEIEIDKSNFNSLKTKLGNKVKYL